MNNPASVIDALLPILRRFCLGEYGIALGGAHAKGAADAQSDLDVYLFAAQTLPGSERTRLCEEYEDRLTAIRSWGDDGHFSQAGTDFTFRQQRVECWLRHSAIIADTIRECQAGIVKHDMVTWTVMGFYNYCTLSDLQKMVPIEDPYGLLANWKSEVAHYPPKLREAILTRSLQAARFWPDNFHYETAVERCDVIYVSGIVQQVVNNLVQIVFALNKTYFPGEKKLNALLPRLSIAPADFVARIERLLAPGVPLDLAVLRRQRGELRQLVAELEVLAAEYA